MINFNNVITNNTILLIKECFLKLISKINMLQWDIELQYIIVFQFCENIIQAICGHPAFVAGLINTLKNRFKLVANVH